MASGRLTPVEGVLRRASPKMFLPAKALRNEIDVGHVSLALLTRRQLGIIHAYTDAAEGAFREMLDRVLDAVAAGVWKVEEFNDPKPSSTVLGIVERLSPHFGHEVA